MKKNNKETIKLIFPYLILLVIILGTIYFFNIGGNKINNLTYDQLLLAMYLYHSF
jgi:hypothetical protein